MKFSRKSIVWYKAVEQGPGSGASGLVPNRDGNRISCEMVSHHQDILNPTLDLSMVKNICIEGQLDAETRLYWPVKRRIVLRVESFDMYIFDIAECTFWCPCPCKASKIMYSSDYFLFHLNSQY